MNKRQYFLYRGVTLIELIISIVIISIAVGGIMALFLGTTSSSADPMIRAQSLAVAQSYMDEIMMQPYSNDGVTLGRANYNEVSDYDTAGAFLAVQDQLGNPIIALSGYTVKVAVTTPGLNGVNDMKKIVLTVKHAGLKAEVPLISYRSDYGN
ncbi:MAG: prepilin-type N-terminal cleavage/methylation domain-containing protein [gamma proteobacterium symbiont of Bathyaustriella thionipta]|nr:prepilin-type N-terminal cleavage/methylation domain-containing protein [gamma proteobacterium symbiont of Bathyaustriella thionipta]MCU7950424.1 prepilin-type N-terminal cleavage/methylation domain-containing protein [gamma proteobacterium symbiont of Bathyaustriella thionipta]MCU7953074.1 prepilin-type N-terminal cleavage/methylation domain-containing protein [gamma proteobacterium symbiont of Bathyaustriella thionipta]MCU7956930.1 prepilin-type N-terminal cleavage/methylation domain-contai